VASRIEVAAAQRPAAGETACGDEWVYIRGEESCLVAVIDALGHGVEAHRTARAARHVIEAHPDLDLTDLVKVLSGELQRLRGACIAFVRIFEERSWMVCLSIGNVEISAISENPIQPVPCPGIVGQPIRRMREFEFTLNRGDRLFIFSDGVSRRADLRKLDHLGPQEAAEAVVTEYGLPHDDATCVVIDYAKE
jgi:phosphoserine phosphatase RsbX